MTVDQISQAKAMAGKIRREEIAKILGVSVVNLKRSMPGVSFATTWKYKRNPELVARVLKFYFANGMRKTKERFPDVNVKSIVDRPEHYGIKRIPRQIRWTEKQKVELVRMAGLVSYGAQARYFGRPGAAGGSIKSAWLKIFDKAPSQLNGMPYDTAKHIAVRGTEFIRPVGDGRRGGQVDSRWVVLWVDLENRLRPECGDAVRTAVKTMADYQRWLWNDKDPKRKILKMIREREL